MRLIYEDTMIDDGANITVRAWEEHGEIQVAVIQEGNSDLSLDDLAIGVPPKVARRLGRLLLTAGAACMGEV